MRVDLVVPNEGAFAAEALQRCGELERFDFGGLWFTDHVVAFETFRPVYGDYWLEVLSAVTYAAATTRDIRLGIGVLVLPYRDAVYAAKALASIDVLSGGRLDLGVGTGWSRAEFYAVGRQHLYETRGAYTNEALEVMTRCWEAPGDVTFDGEFHRFRNVRFQPKPVQRPRIPLWIGARGTTRAPLERAARFADVWHPTGIAPDAMASASARLNELAGREIPVSIRGQLPASASVGEIVDWLAAYREAGCVQAAVDMKSQSLAAFMADAANLAEAARAVT